MIRFFRRLWARWTHKHDWVVIWRGTMTVKRIATRQKWRENVILERCHCGHERCRAWGKYQQEWRDIDMDWANDQLARMGEEIPARHQE